MDLWALTRWCFLGAAPSIHPGVLPKIWHYGLLQIDGALLEQHHLLIRVSFYYNYGVMGSYESMVLYWLFTICIMNFFDYIPERFKTIPDIIESPQPPGDAESIASPDGWDFQYNGKDLLYIRRLEPVSKSSYILFESDPTKTHTHCMLT